MSVWTLPCAQAGCDQGGTHVVVQSHGLALLFPTCAGVVCKKHAMDMAAIGGVPLPLSEYRECALREAALRG